MSVAFEGNDDDHCRQTVLNAALNLPEKNGALRQAVEVCPRLVKVESNPLFYWRIAQGNVKVAAHRLAAVWEHRLFCFGAERAFLHLTPLDGKGALMQEEIDELNQEYLLILPPNSNKQGRQVSFLNFVKASNSRSARSARLRINFLHLSQMGWNSQGLGEFVTVRLSNSPQYDKTKICRITKLVQLFPTRQAAWINVFLPPPGAKRMFQKTVIPCLEQDAGEEARKIMTSFVCESTDEILQELQRLGFCNKEALPPSLGGNWCSPSEMLAEKKKPAALLSEAVLKSNKGGCESLVALSQKRAAAASFSLDQQASAPPHRLKQPPPSPSSSAAAEIPPPSTRKKKKSEMTPQERQAEAEARLARRRAKKREIDVKYARKRRQQEKDLIDGLQRECCQLEGKRAKLQRENKRLTNLVDTAESIVRIEEGKQDRSKASADTPRDSAEGSSTTSTRLSAGVPRSPPPSAVAAPPPSSTNMQFPSTLLPANAPLPAISSPPPAAATANAPIPALSSSSDEAAMLRRGAQQQQQQQQPSNLLNRPGGVAPQHQQPIPAHLINDLQAAANAIREQAKQQKLAAALLGPLPPMRNQFVGIASDRVLNLPGVGQIAGVTGPLLLQQQQQHTLQQQSTGLASLLRQLVAPAPLPAVSAGMPGVQQQQQPTAQQQQQDLLWRALANAPTQPPVFDTRAVLEREISSRVAAQDRAGDLFRALLPAQQRQSSSS